MAIERKKMRKIRYGAEKWRKEKKLCEYGITLRMWKNAVSVERTH